MHEISFWCLFDHILEKCMEMMVTAKLYFMQYSEGGGKGSCVHIAHIEPTKMGHTYALASVTETFSELRRWHAPKWHANNFVFVVNGTLYNSIIPNQSHLIAFFAVWMFFVSGRSSDLKFWALLSWFHFEWVWIRNIFCSTYNILLPHVNVGYTQ